MKENYHKTMLKLEERFNTKVVSLFPSGTVSYDDLSHTCCHTQETIAVVPRWNEQLKYPPYEDNSRTQYEVMT